jgi:rhodanese-related sulfurtransferase
MSPRLPAALLLAFALLSGCEGGPRISDRDVRLVSYPRLRQMLDQPTDKKSSFALIDVRRAAEYAQGHIAGAVNVPLPELRATHPSVARAETVVVYGGNWRQAISAAAAKRLITQGRENVLDFRGGLEQWRERGGPIEPAGAATAPRDTAGRPDAAGDRIDPRGG